MFEGLLAKALVGLCSLFFNRTARRLVVRLVFPVRARSVGLGPSFLNNRLAGRGTPGGAFSIAPVPRLGDPCS